MAPARSDLRTGAVMAEILTALGSLGDGLRVVDAGGGTGGAAVPLALAGHRVTVLDPSPDSLATLSRRAAEAGVADRVTAVQGDLDDLCRLVEPGADAVLCHRVLEVVDDPAVALACLAAALRPGGLASVLTANRLALVVQRALAGRFAEAGRYLEPVSRPGPVDYDELVALVSAAGLAPLQVHGIRVVADLVPGALLDSEPGATTALLELEQRAADHPALLRLATQLHVLATRPAGAPGA